MWHDSEVAAVGYAIEQIVERRQSCSMTPLTKVASSMHISQENSHQQDGFQNVMAGKKCPECGAHALIKKDGCEYCTSCGHLGTCG
jgi:ribonucleoside-diphosphate reductase alpha chain